MSTLTLGALELLLISKPRFSHSAWRISSAWACFVLALKPELERGRQARCDPCPRGLQCSGEADPLAANRQGMWL